MYMVTSFFGIPTMMYNCYELNGYFILWYTYNDVCLQSCIPTMMYIYYDVHGYFLLWYAYNELLPVLVYLQWCMSTVN